MTTTPYACGLCRFYISPGDEDRRAARGEPMGRVGCHRYPETLSVQPLHWCGEFQPQIGLSVGNFRFPSRHIL